MCSTLCMGCQVFLMLLSPLDSALPAELSLASPQLSCCILFVDIWKSCSAVPDTHLVDVETGRDEGSIVMTSRLMDSEKEQWWDYMGYAYFIAIMSGGICSRPCL